MRELGMRILKRSLPVAVVMAILGYLLANLFLWFHKIYGGSAYDPANERVLWEAPLRMAIFGVALVAIIEAVRFALWRKRVTPPVETPTNP
jgi:putative copper export protein